MNDRIRTRSVWRKIKSPTQESLQATRLLVRNTSSYEKNRLYGIVKKQGYFARESQGCLVPRVNAEK